MLFGRRICSVHVTSWADICLVSVLIGRCHVHGDIKYSTGRTGNGRDGEVTACLFGSGIDELDKKVNRRRIL